MSGGGEKTEKPTARKLQQAREQGQVCKSQDLNGAVVLGTVAVMLGFVGPMMFQSLFAIMRETFEELPKYGKADVTIDTLSKMIEGVIHSITFTLLPLIACVVVMAVLINLLQVRPMLSPQAIAPKWDKLNPLNGFKRMFSMRSWIEALKAFFKMGVIGTVGVTIINNHQGEFITMLQMDLISAWMGILGIIGEIAVWSCIMFIVLGAFDWWYQAYEFEKQLRMSKQDIKEEHKSQDGDPMIKNRIRQMGIQISRNRQLAEVPTADVIITNPTHYSIAIKYDPDKSAAPIVIAKGVDHFAMKIREVAKANNIPIVENKPVARALYKMCEPGMMIPPDMFVFVAEILALIFAKNKGRKYHAKRSSIKNQQPV